MIRPPAERSALIMPIVTERFVAAAWRRGADAIVLDLEDSVPEELKAHARQLVKGAIPIVARGGASVHVRLNHDTALEELDDVVWPGVSHLLYPKAETAEEIRLVDERITVLEEERGIASGTIELTAMIETPRGVANAMEIAEASTRIVRFGGGLGYDMATEYRIDNFADVDPWIYTTGECELAGRAAGAVPNVSIFLPNPTGSVSDAAWTETLAAAAKRCGSRGSGALNPAVVEALNRGFTPTPDELAEAEQTLQEYHRLSRTRRTWTRSNGRVVDRYEAERAEELLWWASVCRQRDAAKQAALASGTDVS